MLSLHFALHFLAPGAVTLAFFRKQWQKAFLLMIATMLVDIDHVLADPIYDPSRCSMGTHPLHEPMLLGPYTVLCFFPKTRYIGVGLVIHMLLDSLDCQRTNGVWFL
ncbi:MAG: DUF6122 family protein [Gammaproteobacteria bacterium]|nr:DUF6122 family protein [Gammaproteobacteria bacterium]MDP6537650.1 DUF6122 family protein [Gammaproteobacteria bacterium]MDP6732928.1 DUF6122 family protein [Gammaproteobacteria bacterium]HAJ75121.1 hypothetical protein [Gammaproteobacteria bacterium]